MSTILDYSRLLAHAENEVGSVHSLNTGAFSQGFSSNTIPLSENIVYNAHHGTHIYQSIPYLDDNGQSRWNPGLDDWWQSSTSMDWADALNYTFWGPEHGMPQCQVGDQGLIFQESCALGQFPRNGKGTPCPCRPGVYFSSSPPSRRIICGPPKVRFALYCDLGDVDILFSNVAAYSMNANPPLPYRLKSSTLRFQIPAIGVSKLVPDTRFIRAMRDSRTWQLFATMLFKVRTWARATIWGDRVSGTP